MAEMRQKALQTVLCLHIAFSSFCTAVQRQCQQVNSTGGASHDEHAFSPFAYDNAPIPNATFKGNVYVIGNGALREEDHAELALADPGVIFRCNTMLNLRLNESVGGVYVRQQGTAHGVTGSYAGIFKTSEYCPRIQHAKEITLIGHLGFDNVSLDRALLESKFPGVDLRGVYKPRSDVPPSSSEFDIQLNGTSIRCPKHVPACKGYGWSTGFLAIILTRMRFPKAQLHVMGMNWNDPEKMNWNDPWKAMLASKHLAPEHPWRTEKKVITNLKSVTVHNTAATEYHPGRRCETLPS
eukprot:gnl/TRDRNA2_/TRDRNA2_191519_c0_seq1.p1 gnl/TRDRNA2_/TRDRNA2_191519_c0~~gnl/TRDRNA2_/TRDRNA2_191519_c0_seq1.p1  ORF type:complete len:309 (-),score=24.66 gnl/TRDRNA2_/TRDRNA2_191519_c0_seq1:49-936(-)